MRVLVTGGCGNLGRHSADELAAHGHQPFLFDRKGPDEVPLPFATEHPFLRGELTSGEDCLRVVEESKAEAIIHLGAIPPRDRSSGYGCPLPSARRQRAAGG